ncbi:MAG: metallophosphoesterase [Bacteroidales bacterium]|nr:metallophosphoesterase [Bacteroidales bacterium]
MHRGGSWRVEPIGDHKDSAVSGLFAETIVSPMESDFIESIKQWQYNHGNIDAIVCTGDLGDKGNSSRIDEGVSFVHKIQEALGINTANVLICPGNHDADRGQSPELMFSGYCNALSKFSFTDHRTDDKPFFINGIPFVVVNTSLGAGEKSVFIRKYIELVNGLSDSDKRSFEEELNNAGVQYLDDSLDIPVVTNLQRQRIKKAISDTTSSFVVLVMHHNLLPCNMVEIRPYSSVIDAGKTLDDLMETQKDVLIVHGHVHFSSSSIIRRPDRMHCISSVGTGLFNGRTGSSINIVEVFCSDDGQHFITVVYEYIEQINGLQFNKSTSICDKIEKDSLDGVLSYFIDNPGIGAGFDEIRTAVGCSEKELLSTLLLNGSLFNISRNKSSNPSQWIIHRN